MPADPSPHPLDLSAREFNAHRAAVLSMLRISYPWIEEPEELVQVAWIELLELQRRGQKITHPRALLKKIAERRAVDAGRRRTAEPIEPLAPEITERLDESEPIEYATAIHLEADLLLQVVERIPPQDALMIKLRFKHRLLAREIQELLGMSVKRFEKRMAKAYEAVRAELGKEDPEQAERWRGRQRSLLLACEIGIATPEQRAHAQDLIDRDPFCRAMLREMRTTLRDIAAAVPLPPIALELHERRGPLNAMLDWADKALAVARPSSGDVLVSRASSTLTEQATGTLAGGLGLGVGGAVKIVAACIALGGTAAVCVESVVPQLKTPAPKRVESKKPKRVAKPRPAPPVVAAPVVARVEAQPVTGKRVRQTQAQLVAKAKAKVRAAQARETPVSSPQAQPPASPVPAGTTEFGPGNSGSDPVAPTPAPAPQNGGGEFGP